MSFPRTFLFALLPIVFATACSHPSKQADVPQPLRGPVVLVAVLDQAGAEYVERYLPYLHQDGAIWTAIKNGAYFHRGQYTYAATYTAPGHATIYCGANPSVSESSATIFRIGIVIQKPA
ncbi:MAG: hypothetical protein R3A47_09290 [Polyangiales bacterium]